MPDIFFNFDCSLREKYENERKKSGKGRSLRSIMSDEELNELRKLIQAPHAISRRDLDLIYPGYHASLSLSLSLSLRAIAPTP